MMTKNEKKECFLRIVEIVFEDISGEITPDNCISFYHYLLDCLESERSVFSFDPKFKIFLDTIIDFLSKFDQYLETRPEYQELISDLNYRNNFILDAMGTLSLSEVVLFFDELRALYQMIKEEFLI